MTASADFCIGIIWFHGRRWVAGDQGSTQIGLPVLRSVTAQEALKYAGGGYRVWLHWLGAKVQFGEHSPGTTT